MQVLGGVSICFYGFGANDDPKLAQPKSLAQTFGAQCFSSRYSHIIGLRYTAKVGLTFGANCASGLVTAQHTMPIVFCLLNTIGVMAGYCTC